MPNNFFWSLLNKLVSLDLNMLNYGNTELSLEQPPPLLANYNTQIRPLLDAIDKLRHLQVTKEGIQLPTIVVVGDQSSGKSSVLESLAGINLPRGQGICTRVPLIMRLQHHSSPAPEIFLEFPNKRIYTDESNISEAISNATDEIAGKGKGISNTPLTLVVRKQGVPDLTMIDLPGITRVSIRDQPEDIYEHISSIIMEYISPKESIILNVLSAAVDFSTCESIRMSRKVDKTGERTLAVVTKCDVAPQGLLEKVTADDVGIGLGYVCVRNRCGEESYESARLEEARLFESHPLLSGIDKSIVGTPVLAQKLVQIQAIGIAKCLPDIAKKINEKLNQNVADLSRLPQNLTSIADVMILLMRVLGSVKESLRKILLRGEFDEYPDEVDMHGTARLADMLNEYSNEIQSKSDKFTIKDSFLMEEIKILEETKGIDLPNFLPRTAFCTLLKRKVNDISETPVEFVQKVWRYIEKVVLSVVTLHAEGYPELKNSARRATHVLISKMREKCIDRVKEMIETEKAVDYTSNPEYLSTWNTLMASQPGFMSIIKDNGSSSTFTATDYGKINIKYLREYRTYAQQAFDLNARLNAYWKIVLRRLVDNLGIHLVFNVTNLVENEMEREIVNEIMDSDSGGMERMLEESPSDALKRGKLKASIEMLKESKEVVSSIMDKIADHRDSVFRKKQTNSGGMERMLEESPTGKKKLEESPSDTLKRGKLMAGIEMLKESKEVVSSIMDKIVDHGDSVFRKKTNGDSV